MNKSKTNWIISIVVVAIILVIIITTLTKNPGQNSAIKVGIISPLTGSAAAYGIEGKNALVMAFDEINANGGIAGKKVEYFVEDGKCDAKAALDAWNKLVSIDKVQAVFGGHCSTETLAIAPLSIRDQVPIFAVFVTAPKIENEGEWLFRNMSTNTYFGSVLADQAYKKGYRKVAVLTEEKDFPVSYSDEFISDFKKLGGTIALDERFTSDTNDYRTLALKLKAVDYDSIFISTQGSPTMGLIAKQINDLGLVKPMLFTHAFSYVNFTKASGGFLPKDMVVVESYADPNAPKVKKFDSSYVAKYGQIYNSINKFFIAADYDVAYRFKDAATGCVNDDNLDIDCVRAAFKSATSYSGVAGNIAISSKYSPDGIATPMGTLSVVDGKEVLSPIK